MILRAIIDQPSIPWLSSDLYGGAIQIEKAFGDWLAEGDKTIQGYNRFCSYNHSSGAFTFSVETDHATWEDTGVDLRYHNNLMKGFIPYADLCSDDPSVFDDYSIEMKTVSEDLVVFVHSGSTNRPSYTFVSKYTKRTLYGGGTFYSKLDHGETDATADIAWLYDKRIVYGSPSYETLRNGIRTKLLETIKTGSPLLDYIQLGLGDDFSEDVSVFDRITGKITVPYTVAGTYATVASSLYKINSVDLSIDIDEFITAEHDLHGRMGAYLNFNDHLSLRGKHINFKKSTADAENLFNIPTALVNVNDGMEKNVGEEEFAATKYFHAGILAVYDYYRKGFHSETDLFMGDDTPNVDVLGIHVKVPLFSNKLITGVSIIVSPDLDDVNITSQNFLEYIVKFRENITSVDGWSYYTTFVDGDGTPTDDGDCFLKTYRYDVKASQKSGLGGNLFQETNYPAFEKVTDPDAVDFDNVVLAPDTFSDVYSFSRMVKDYSFAGSNNIFLNNRLFSINTNYGEYQNGTLDGSVETDVYNLLFSGIASGGANYHLFQAVDNILPNNEIGRPVAMTIVNMPSEINSAVQADRNALLILAREGYRYINLASGNPKAGPNTTYHGDCCVSKASVCLSNGFAYCAGNDGVYMFSGQQKLDITRLGDSDIGLTWRSYSEEIKASSIGVFDTGNKSYLLAIKDTFKGVSGHRIWVFDFEVEQIYSYFVSIWGQDLFKLNYIDGVLYAFTNGNNRDFFSNFYSGAYGQYTDKGLLNGSLNEESFIHYAETNPQNLHDRMFNIRSIIVDYSLSAQSATFSIITDGEALYDVTIVSGSNKRKDHKFNRDYDPRCKTFAFKIESLYNLELHAIGVEVVESLQRKWNKNAQD